MANMVFDKQAQRMLGKRRRARRWIPVAACLVLIVAVGTFYFMMQQGQAMAWRDMELDCHTSVHAHTEACFDVEGKNICGLADYVVHEHVDECYDKDGKLVCDLRQVKEHHHDETCYEKVNVAMACGLDESVGHVHSDACYDPELVCGMQETAGHSHDESCYNEDDELICGMVETEGHTHTSECYNEVLVCGMEAGESGHIHTDSCMQSELVLMCQKPEVSLHTHNDQCYDFFDEEGEPLSLEDAIDREEKFAKIVADGEMPDFELPVRVLMCGMLQTEQHEHGNECFKKIEVEPESESSFESSQLESSDVESSDVESSSALESSELESDVESSQLEGEEEAEEPVVPEEDSSTVYEDETLKITAEFKEELPEGTQLVVERLEDANQLAQKQAKLKRTMEDEEYSLHALLQVTLQDEDGTAVEFDENAVTLTAEFFGEGAGAEGAQICAVAYREAEADPEWETVPGMVLDLEKAEILPVTLGTNGGAVTEIAEDTLLGYASKAPVKVDADDVDGDEVDASGEDNVLHLDQSFSYNTESMFELVFHIQGDAELVVPENSEEPAATPEPSEEPVPWGEDVPSDVEGEEPVMTGMSDFDIISSAESSNALEPDEDEDAVSSEPADEPESEPAQSQKKGLGGVTVATGSVLPSNIELQLDQSLEFAVERVQDGDPAYKPYADYVQIDEEDPDQKITPLEVLSYKLYYGGQELDLSGCEITVDVMATSELQAVLDELASSEEDEVGGDVAMLVSLLGPTDSVVQENEYAIYTDAEAVARAQEEAQTAEAIREVAEENLDTTTDNGVSLLESKDVTRDTTGAIMSLRLRVAGVQSADEPEVGLTSFMNSLQTMFLAGGGEERPVKNTYTLALASNATLNPTFRVEYYSYINMVDWNASGNQLAIINTEVKNDNKVKGTAYGENYINNKLPKNGNSTNPTNNSFKYLSLDGSGSVIMHKVPTNIYESIDCEYFLKPNLQYFDAIANSGDNQNGDSYILRQVWVWRGDDNAESIDAVSPQPAGISDDGKNLIEGDWEIYGEPYEGVLPNHGSVATGKCINRIHFTNKSAEELKELEEKGEGFIKEGHLYIRLTENDTVRLVYEPIFTVKDNVSASFYDYDISNGWIYRARPPVDKGTSYYVHKTSGVVFDGLNFAADLVNWCSGVNLPSGWDGHIYTYTQEQGINSSGNYSGSDTKLAFGNVNTGTGLGRLTWSKDGVSNELNKYNNKGYQGCTFGLVTGMSDGKIQYASGIQAPKLFNEGPATGKTQCNYSLKFNRSGDTYTLTEVSETVATNLDKFSNPTNSTGTHTDIWTNNFWPMDSADSFGTGTHDVKFGGTATFKGKAHEIRFGPITEKKDDYTFPESDDGKYHNSYFGMHFSLSFNLVKQYIGPLEYLFFGDDDMWVFLTPMDNGTADYSNSKLVCDIGGVHSSVGEYVNLWNYVEVDAEGKAVNKEYQLDFFYTERGASGSTCWMQFILPSVRAQETSRTVNTGNLRIEKKVDTKRMPGDQSVNPWEGFNGDETFLFKLTLKDGEGKPLDNDYGYTRYKIGENGEEVVVSFLEELEGTDFYEELPDIDKGKLQSQILDRVGLASNDGVTLLLKSDEYIVIEGLPLGAQYTIEELLDVKGDVKYDSETDKITVDGVAPLNDYVTSWKQTQICQEKDGNGGFVYDNGNPVFTGEEHASGDVSSHGDCQDYYKVSGTINYPSAREEHVDIQTVLYCNTVYAYELPKTGGEGTGRYIWASAALVVLALVLIYTSTRKRGKEVVRKP